MPRAAPLLLLIALAASPAYSQNSEPVLRSGTRTIDVIDGGRLRQGVWSCDPSVDRDVYRAMRSAEPRTITFVSDTDSLSLTVEPDREYDFVILVDGKDACSTRISTHAMPAASDATPGAPVTIPISIKRGKVHLSGSVNGSATLDLIFDTGANINVLYPSGLRKGVTLQFDGVTDNAGTGGVTRRQTSSANTLRVGNLHWDSEPFLFIEKQADDADGIVGYTVFEDRVIELDYDRMVMTVYDTLPGHAERFSRTPMTFVGALTAVDTTILTGNGPKTAPCLLDTGGTGALLVNQRLAADLDLHGSLPPIGRSVSRGVGSASIKNTIMLAPEVRLAGYAVTNVPIDVANPVPGNHPPPQGLLCTELLRRFNSILDYSTGQAYFAPNSRFAEPFPSRAKGAQFLLAIAIGAAVAATILLRARARRPSARNAPPIV